MRKLSQKELYNEGIGGLMKGVGGALGGTIGAGVGALKAASKAGTDATWGGVAGGAARGAMTGAKIGHAPIKTAKSAVKDAWDTAAGGRRLGNNKEDLQLVAYLETLGYIPDPKSRYGIQGDPNVKSLEVIPFDWDASTGEKKPGRAIPNAMRTFKGTGGSWKETPPVGGGSRLPPYTPKNAPITSSFCQKDLLRQLTLLSD